MKQPGTGYSGTPLAKKLGFSEHHRIRLVNQPGNYFDLLPGINLSLVNDKKTKKDCIHFFTSNAEELFKKIPELRNEIVQNGMIWVSWPKKTSRIKTDITEDVIRTCALSNGLVDIKVCAIDEIWSGLKLVIPLKLRNPG